MSKNANLDASLSRLAAAVVAVVLASGPASVLAQEGAADALAEPPPVAPLPAVPEPPDLPKRVQSGEAFEPQVTIRRDAERTITEYRVNGILRAVKVETKGFPDYYIVDTNGDGRVDTRQDGLDNDLLIPQWVLFRW